MIHYDNKHIINYKISIPHCNTETIITCFTKIQLLCLAEFVKTILTKLATHYMSQERQPFECESRISTIIFIIKGKGSQEYTNSFGIWRDESMSDASKVQNVRQNDGYKNKLIGYGAK